MIRLAAFVLLLSAALAPCRAASVEAEVLSLDGSGQITIPLPPQARVAVRQRGAVVELTLPSGLELATPATVPRNVVSITGGSTVQLTRAADTRFHFRFSKNPRVFVFSVLDPAKRDASAAAFADTRPNPAKIPVATAPIVAAPVLTATADAPPVIPAPVTPVTEVPSAAPAPASDPFAASPSDVPSTSISAAASPRPARPATRSFTVSAAADTGVAAFRRGELGTVVFDDEARLANGDAPTLTPTFRAIPRGTVVTVPLAADEALAVTRSEGTLTVTVATPTGSPADLAAVPVGMEIQVGKPGRVVALSDPVSDQVLLIGTTRQVSGEHAFVAARRAAPGYALLPTWLGVALETSSDQVDLRVSLAGYVLAIADRASRNGVAAARPQNQFDIPTASVAALNRELDARITSAAAAPVRARGPDRVAAARTMLALGLSTEAAALLTLAANDDPAVARDPAVAALSGIAAVLAGRPDDADGLDQPALPTGGDMALWRGLRDAARGKPAPALAGAWPLLAAYPEAIRQRIAPAVMEAAARAGADVPPADMAGSAFALARALKLVHDGQTDPAVAALTEVRNSRDERASVQAAVALTELLLRTGRIGPGEAADQLSRQTVRWRGDRLELQLQLRVAGLRSDAAQWRTALTGLRDLQAVLPAHKEEIAAAQAEVFRSLIGADPAKVSPLEMVLIATDFAGVLPGGEDGDRLAVLVADKLAALDLPTRAVPVLKSLLSRSDSPVARAEYGLRLAQMQLDAGDAPAAEALLASLDLSAMPAGRQAQRTVLQAQAQAAQGNYAGAAATLLTVSTPAADEMRASYYARAGDWQRSLEALDGIVAATVPESGDLSDAQQELVLREATAAVQAGDAEALKRLARFNRRLSAARADLFRVLTASAIRGPEDLPRAARELAASRTLPERLTALRSR